MKTYSKIASDSFLAGIIIGIATYANIVVGELAGAVLFSVGLLCIIEFKLQLFTGQCGYLLLKENIINKKTFLLKLLIMLIFNILGVLTCKQLFLISGMINNDLISDIVSELREIPYYVICIQSIFCGIMVKLAVESKNKIIVLICTTVFVICGFKHSIVNSFYLVSKDYINMQILIIMVYGNLIGSLIPVSKN